MDMYCKCSWSQSDCIKHKHIWNGRWLHAPQNSTAT